MRTWRRAQRPLEGSWDRAGRPLSCSGVAQSQPGRSSVGAGGLRTAACLPRRVLVTVCSRVTGTAHSQEGVRKTRKQNSASGELNFKGRRTTSLFRAVTTVRTKVRFESSAANAAQNRAITRAGRVPQPLVRVLAASTVRRAGRASTGACPQQRVG